MACAGSVILPVGMFWFAWTVQPSVHWAVPIAASILVGLGMLLIFLGLVYVLLLLLPLAFTDTIWRL